MAVIKAEQLTKRYHDVVAVNRVSFEVEKGTLLGFLGVNGAGKTTVINMLVTLLTPDGGSAEVCGEILGRGNQEIRRKTGIVYQQNCLDDIMTVRENLMCRGILHGASRREARSQCSKLGEILKLEGLMEKRYRTLSGGQKRRVEIGAALMHTPELLFLDEPTTGLDPATRLDVWNTISNLQKNEKMTVFLTTHYMEEAAGADKIIIMDSGSLITMGTPFELKETYARDRVRIYCWEGRGEEMAAMLAGIGIEAPKPDSGMFDIPVPSTLEALPILEAVKEAAEGFEVILGDMDDVFLNAVGRDLQEKGGE